MTPTGSKAIWRLGSMTGAMALAGLDAIREYFADGRTRPAYDLILRPAAAMTY